MMINNGSDNEKVFYGLLVFFSVVIGTFGYFITNVK